MYERVDSNSLLLRVSLEKILFGETVVNDRGCFGCEVKLRPSFQPAVVHFMINKKRGDFDPGNFE